MAYKQKTSFDQNKAGKQPGYCLKNVRLGFGIGSKYDNAWEAWQNTDQHTDAIPQGVDVPVYFWWKDESNGHIGVRLANGKFWSDGTVYESIDAYMLAKAPDYVGWSTSVNGVSVLQYVEGGETWVHLSEHVAEWRLYLDLNEAPVAKNADKMLKPAKFGGLDYKVVEFRDNGMTAVIDTKDYGRGKIYLDQDATIYTK